jgi:hypothetical protein
MATATVEYPVTMELKLLSLIPVVDSVHVLPARNTLAVWIGITSDDPEARESIYRFEDKISDRYPSVMFDFHVIPLPPGRKMGDFVTDSEAVFQRIA